MKYKLIIFTTLVFIFSGCGVWRDFTAYFNGYYNAAKIFDEAEAQIISQKKEIFTFNEVQPQNATVQNLNKVVEKLSKILQFKSNSGLVDDALFMTGRSFYYQKNYQKGIRKFTELIANYPESGLILDAQLWIVKSQFRLKNYNQALQIMDGLYKKASEEEKSEIMAELLIEHATYFIVNENYSEAIKKAGEFLELSGDNQKKARVAFETGNLYAKINNYEKAAEFYSKVNNFTPDYETEFEAELAFGKIQRELNNSQKALEIFGKIRSEKNYSEYLNRTELEIAFTHLKLQNFDEALYKFKLIDTAFSNTSSSGIAVYNIGKLMEFHYENYDSANSYYKKTMNSRAPKEILDSAYSKVAIFSKYQNIMGNLNFYKKQLEYINDSTAYKRDSIAYFVEQARVDSLNKELQAKAGNVQQEVTQNPAGRGSRAQTGNARNTQQNQNLQQVKNNLRFPSKPRVSIDSVKSILAKNEYELGGLFFTELDHLDSAKYYYEHILNNYRGSNYEGRTLYALGSYYLTVKQDKKADSLYQIVYDNFKNESIANAAAQKLNLPLIKQKIDPAEEIFLNAEVKFQQENFDEAVKDFIGIYRQYPKSSYAPKALYTTGWIFENKLGKPDSAVSMYDSLVIKYPSTQYANQVREKVEIYKMHKEEESLRNEEIPQENIPSEELPSEELPQPENDSTNPNNQNRINEKINPNPKSNIPPERLEE